MANHHTSEASKRLAGTFRPARAVPPAERLTAPPRAPAGMSKAAAAEWRRLAGVLVHNGVLSAGDLTALGLLAEALATAREMRAVVMAEGLLVQGDRGARKAHPAARLAVDARAEALRLLEAFGLTPASRHRVDRAPVQVADGASPWGRMRSLRGCPDGEAASVLPLRGGVA